MSDSVKITAPDESTTLEGIGGTPLMKELPTVIQIRILNSRIRIKIIPLRHQGDKDVSGDSLLTISMNKFY
jgi:hypothetical protein